MHRLFAPFQLPDHRLDSLLRERVEAIGQKPSVLFDALFKFGAFFAHGSPSLG